MVSGMSSTRWWNYIKPIIGDMTMRDAAKKAGFNQSAFTRWKGGAKADPEFVVKFARAFHLNVLEALVEAEFITEEEAGTNDSDQQRRQVAQKLEKRLNDVFEAQKMIEVRFSAVETQLLKTLKDTMSDEQWQAFTGPLEADSNPYKWAEIAQGLTNLGSRNLSVVSDPPAITDGEDDGTVMEWDDSIPHAADSSPDEQAEREKRGEDLID